MRKLLKSLLALFLCLGLFACSSDEVDETDSSDNNVADETVEETATHDYDVNVYSSDNVDIVLNYISSDEISFDVTNNLSQNISVDCYYIQLDGIETDYFYGDEFYSYLEDIASNDSLEVKLDLSVSNTNCKEFSGIFGIWDGDDGTLIEYANVSKTTINEESEAEFNDLTKDKTNIYSGDNVEAYIDTINEDTVILDITNKTDKVISVDCSYIKLDDVTYKDEDLEWGAKIIEIASNDTRKYVFIESSDGLEIDSESKSISGILNVWDGNTGYDVETVDISNVSIE